MTIEERNQIIAMTFNAIRRIDPPRFFLSERGYQGELYCKLREEFLSRDLLGESLLELEYQKRPTDHLTQQRPDIIYHVPADLGGDVEINNYAVWALKLAAGKHDAQNDFEKLYEMMALLHYPLAIFVNINSEAHYLDSCREDYRDRMVAFTTMRNVADGRLLIRKAYFDHGRLQEHAYSFALG